MVRSPRPASSLAATIWSMPRILTPPLPSPRGFPAPRMGRSRSGRSWFMIDGCSKSHSGFANSRVPEWPHCQHGFPMNSGEIEKIFRDEAGRALATLIRLVGDFDLAPDALQDAFAIALERWPAADPPSNPRAWLVNVGRNKAIDRVRRQMTFRGKRSELTHELLLNASPSDETVDAALDDDMLRLIFTCCHPSFAAEVQVALTLRTVCGLTTAQVARAFLVSEDAMGQRLVRAKQKNRLAGIAYAVPDRDALG